MILLLLNYLSYCSNRTISNETKLSNLIKISESTTKMASDAKYTFILKHYSEIHQEYNYQE